MARNVTYPSFDDTIPPFIAADILTLPIYLATYLPTHLTPRTRCSRPAFVRTRGEIAKCWRSL